MSLTALRQVVAWEQVVSSLGLVLRVPELPVRSELTALRQASEQNSKVRRRLGCAA